MKAPGLRSTFSIAAFDPCAKVWGVAAQSKYLAVGAVVPWARAGVGAIATQARVNVRYGPESLELLSQDLSPKAVIERISASDPGRAWRQIGLVDRYGRAAAYIGGKCFPWAGSRGGEGYTCQGNMLTSARVIGDRRGQQSALLLVVKERGGPEGLNDCLINLRVDDHPTPIVELERLLTLQRGLSAADECRDPSSLPIGTRRKIVKKLGILGYFSDMQTKAENIKDSQLLDALERYAVAEELHEYLGMPLQMVAPALLEFLDFRAYIPPAGE